MDDASIKTSGEYRTLAMTDAPLAVQLSFFVHFIRIHGPEDDPFVLTLMVEATKAQPVYLGFGTWSQCRRWIAQISGYTILGDQLATVQKRLERKELATIKEIRASVVDLESLGFRRVDSSTATG